MKKLFYIPFCVLMASCSSEQQPQATEASAQQPSDTKAGLTQVKVGFIASATGNAPLNSLDEKGMFEGFEHDILQEVAKRANYNFTYEYKPRKQLMDDVENDGVQIVAGNISITEDRVAKYAMTNSYLDAYPVTILSKDAELKSMEQLKDKSVAIKDSPIDTFYDVVNTQKAEEKDNIHYVNSDWLAVKNVLSGDSVAAIGNSSVMPYYFEKYSTKETPLHFAIDYAYPQESYGFLLKKDNKQLLDDINKSLADMKADGTYQSIFKKWF
ncbi:extracellular solute-binding fmaily protein [Moraxella macacae 0408225]|uniref:Extracellular solute-binding fmaily protein n=1 Tax=Moraxella macacae 0408225 TaxID=1230338 RepID=L2F6K1_9GAMM|nr:transporter substrate-binding domain-containing protein [Moraxella macacae]ELA08662.1 extracellular solute-binding fmaily protein [Moraxella macacae 0408225]